jgi:hypothetical protein
VVKPHKPRRLEIPGWLDVPSNAINCGSRAVLWLPPHPDESKQAERDRDPPTHG